MPAITKLSANGMTRNGEFVKTLQGATGVGFAEGFHVHRDWMAKTITYDQALAIDANAKASRHDYVVNPSQFKFVVGSQDGTKDLCAIELSNGLQFLPTDHSWPQISIKIGVKSSSILREMANDSPDLQDVEAMVKLANNAMRGLKPDSELFFRTYDNGTLRACFSGKYANIDNAWFIQSLQTLLPSGRLSHWNGDEDTIFGNLLLPDNMVHVADDDDSDFGMMLALSNCEIGKRSFSVLPGLFRSICLNGNIWDAVKGTALKRKHMGEIKLETMFDALKDTITKQLPLAQTYVDKMLATRMLNIKATPKTVLAMLAKQCKLEPHEAKTALDAYETLESKDSSLFGLVNAITRMAQTRSPSRQFEIDCMSSGLIDMGRDAWDTLNIRANALGISDLEEIFGMAV